MLHRQVPHDGVKRPLYPLLFHIKMSNYTAKMLLIKAKTQPFSFTKLTPFCHKILRKRDYLRGRLENTHTGKILTIVSSIFSSVSPPQNCVNSLYNTMQLHDHRALFESTLFLTSTFMHGSLSVKDKVSDHRS